MKPATQKQLDYLRRLRVNHPESINIQEASELIDRALRRKKYLNYILAGVIIFYLLACGLAMLVGALQALYRQK